MCFVNVSTLPAPALNFDADDLRGAVGGGVSAAAEEAPNVAGRAGGCGEWGRAGKQTKCSKDVSSANREH